MKIIPAIDLMDGKCVRLTQGDFGKKKEYGADPLETARFFEDQGLRFLHVVDLDGARTGRIVHYRTLEKLAARTTLQIDFGGGLKTAEDVRIALDCGASQVTGGTIAVRDRTAFLGWLERFGVEKIILGADFQGERIATDGWQAASEQTLLPFLTEYAGHGVRHVISTDVGKDGLLAGCALAVYREIRRSLPDLHLTASGGIRGMEELEELAAVGCHGAIVGKALYEGLLTARELGQFQESFPREQVT